MYYIYEIVNLLGTVEYVGETNNPKLRFINHKCKNGLFYKRQDILMNGKLKSTGGYFWKSVYN